MTKPLYFYNGTTFELVGPTTPQSPIAYQTSAPTAPATGDIWIDSDGDVDTYNRQLTRYYFVATAGQTTITGVDANGLTLAYVAGSEAVYVNGALQVRGVDYTATNGTSITNLSALAASDVVEVFAYTAFTVANAYTKSETDGLIQSPYRNLIINGAMQVAQRATSVASLTADGYRTADRWFNYIVTQGTWTQSVENDAPTGSGFRKSLKMLCTTADSSPASGDRLYISQLFEGQNLQSILKGTSSAKQLTVSFWVKSNVTGTYIAELYDNDNTRQVSASYTISSSATWEKKTITFPADVTGTFDNDNAASLELILWLGAGSGVTSGTLNTSWASVTAANRAVGQTNLASATNNYWQITGVQLETGSVATPYEFKPYDEDLRQCQRYYEKSYNVETPVGTNTSTGLQRLTIAQNSIYARATIFFKVPKRAAPTMSFWLSDGTSNQWIWDQIGVGSEADTITGNTPETHSVIFETNGISSTRNNASGHWAAAAEL